MQGLTTVPELRDKHRGKGQLLQHPCGFSIHEYRYQQIVSNQITDRIERQLEQEYAEKT